MLYPARDSFLLFCPNECYERIRVEELKDTLVGPIHFNSEMEVRP
jgi:hypothetical protein